MYKIYNKKFGDLSNHELFKIYNLRSLVFVVEQNCCYLDVDEKDLTSKHLFYIDQNKNQLTSYIRIYESKKFTHIGRVVTNPKYRKKGLSRKLMLKGIIECRKMNPNLKIKISAQTYLKDFYASLNFISTENYYLEDNLPHVEMIYTHAN